METEQLEIEISRLEDYERNIEQLRAERRKKRRLEREILEDNNPTKEIKPTTQPKVAPMPEKVVTDDTPPSDEALASLEEHFRRR